MGMKLSSFLKCDYQVNKVLCDALGVWEILDEAVRILLCTNTIGKGMNPSVLPSRADWWGICCKTVKKENSEFKPAVLCFTSLLFYTRIKDIWKANKVI